MSEPFNADTINLQNWDNFVPVRKKPIVVHACQMNLPEGFRVTTMEGPVVGKQGDYLMGGVSGEKYPCAKEIFEKSYDFVPVDSIQHGRPIDGLPPNGGNDVRS